MRKAKTKSMLLCAMFAAMTAVFSQIALPLPFTPVPVNLATLAVLLGGAVLGAKGGVISQLVYVCLGAVGLPVFTKMTGGVMVLAGPTGGYLIGYILAAGLAGLLTDKLPRRPYVLPIAMICAIAICYLFGTAWYVILTKSAITQALLLCVVPFLPGDALKIAVASLLTPKLRKTIRSSAGR